MAEDDDGVLAVGSHQPVGDVTEIVGVAHAAERPPPRARRARDRARSCRTPASAAPRSCSSTAEDDDVARIYGRLGFERVGTACIAEPL